MTSPRLWLHAKLERYCVRRGVANHLRKEPVGRLFPLVAKLEYLLRRKPRYGRRPWWWRVPTPLREAVGATLFGLHRVRRWKGPCCSTSVAGHTTCGYGGLDGLGEWQFPVRRRERQYAREDAKRREVRPG